MICHYFIYRLYTAHYGYELDTEVFNFCVIFSRYALIFYIEKSETAKYLRIFNFRSRRFWVSNWEYWFKCIYSGHREVGKVDSRLVSRDLFQVISRLRPRGLCSVWWACLLNYFGRKVGKQMCPLCLSGWQPNTTSLRVSHNVYCVYLCKINKASS